MISKAKEIRDYIVSVPENTIINAADVYQDQFAFVTEKNFYKVLERMTRDGILTRLTKGLYYRPKKTRFGNVPLSEDKITEYYAHNGVVLGYVMYNKYGLTTQVGKRVEVLSGNVTEEKKNIGNIFVEKTRMELNEDTVPVIEALDVLQHYSQIEDLNRSALASFLSSFSKEYSDSTADYVINNRKYKKRTIAFMKAILDYKGINNSLEKHLSVLSTYAVPEMEEIFEPASE